MKARKILLAALLLAAVTATANAQGRGGPPPQRDSIMTQQQRDAVRKLREQQMKEMQDLRARHREQLDKILPPAARERMAQRQQRLLREGRTFERQRMQQRMQMGRGGMGAQMRGFGPMQGRGGGRGFGPPGAGMGPQGWNARDGSGCRHARNGFRRRNGHGPGNGTGKGQGMGPGMGQGMGPGMGQGMGPGMGQGRAWGRAWGCRAVAE